MKDSAMGSRILVVGDVMLDRYWFGDVTRLSQEAPVPIVRMKRQEYRAGAAANVAMNCVSLGAEVTLMGLIGADESGLLLRDLLSKSVNTLLTIDTSIKTTEKLRVIGRNQQIVRVDFEEKPSQAIDGPALEQIKNHEIIIFSDYAKGAFFGIQALISYAKSLGKTVLVDPKGYDYSKYSGADLIKPNLEEMREMAGGWASEADLTAKVDKLKTEAMVGAILLTRAGDGMTLYEGSEQPFHIHSTAKEVYDVTGAGDTVMAAVGVALSEGRTFTEAATMANYAAGVAVGKFGTSTVTMKEIKEAMNG